MENVYLCHSQGLENAICHFFLMSDVGCNKEACVGREQVFLVGRGSTYKPN